MKIFSEPATQHNLRELEDKLSFLISDLQEQINDLKIQQYNNIYDFLKEKGENYIIGRHTNCCELEMINKLLKKTFNGIGHIAIRYNKDEDSVINIHLDECIKKHKVFVFEDAILLKDIIKKCELIESENK